MIDKTIAHQYNSVDFWLYKYHDILQHSNIGNHSFVMKLIIKISQIETSS